MKHITRIFFVVISILSCNAAPPPTNVKQLNVTTSTTLAGTTAITGVTNISGTGSVAGLNLNADNLTSGTLPDARFPAVMPATSAASMTNLNASQLLTGTVPLARLSTSLGGNGAADADKL